MSTSRLPTRVSDACRRCRRQKQRCDAVRPCSNCIKARCECLPQSPPATPRAHKRFRTVEDFSSEQLRLSSVHNSKSHHGAMVPHATAAMPTISPPKARSSVQDDDVVIGLANSDSAMDITRRVLRSHATSESRATFAIPGGDFRTRRYSANGYYPIQDLVGVRLPATAVTETLLDVYFYTVHWFSLVVCERTFRQRCHAIVSTGLARNSDRPFLLLLLMMLAMGCHYSHASPLIALQGVDVDLFQRQYLETVRQNFMSLLDEDSLEFIQICILLGSYWLYWGRPKSSFTLLGAATRAAQAICLHRQGTRWETNPASELSEERKRVWWTIYTWDRFATTVYGRPLGISDRDCDTAMPGVFKEQLKDVQTHEIAALELSPYQISLNRVYQIASPVLQNIYSIRSSDGSSSDMIEVVKSVNLAMSSWYQSLPECLDLERQLDLPPTPNLNATIHRLQALSLRLTYLNLQIIVHRGLLADWLNRRDVEKSFRSDHQLPEVGPQVSGAGFEQSLSAALAVSRLVQTKPNLISLTSKTHLLSFLAMNLFTSSIVLFICASSDVLSNAAQEAKRGMSRNLRTFRSFPNAGSLSHQCSVILKDLMQIILEKEKREMLGGFSETELLQDVLPDHNHRQLNTHAGNENPAPNIGGNIEPTDISKHLKTPTPNDFGRTMEELHQVLYDATHVRVPQANEWLDGLTAKQGQNEGNSTLQDWLDHPPSSPNQLNPTEADLTQFWLWNFEP